MRWDIQRVKETGHGEGKGGGTTERVKGGGT